MRERYEVASQWNSNEESLFNALYPVFQLNACSLARVLRSKTCRQVLLVLMLVYCFYVFPEKGSSNSVKFINYRSDSVCIIQYQMINTINGF